MELELRPKCSLSEWALLTMLFHETITERQLRLVVATSSGVSKSELNKSWTYQPLVEHRIEGEGVVRKAVVHPGTGLTAPTGRKALNGLIAKGIVTMRQMPDVPGAVYYTIAEFNGLNDPRIAALYGEEVREPTLEEYDLYKTFVPLTIPGYNPEEEGDFDHLIPLPGDSNQ
jgi:hypothetical protein